jgi:hypothetical protein
MIGRAQAVAFPVGMAMEMIHGAILELRASKLSPQCSRFRGLSHHGIVSTLTARSRKLYPLRSNAAARTKGLSGKERFRPRFIRRSSICVCQFQCLFGMISAARHDMVRDS